MNIWIGIPTGQRADQAARCVNAWKDAGLKVCVYSWDKQTTENVLDVADLIIEGNRQPFGILQNKMMKAVHYKKEMDGWICGADDLWPDKGIELIQTVINKYPDKLLWVADGLFNSQATHPVFGVKFYESFYKGVVFDELFKHNYVDTDLFVRMAQENRIIKCFDIQFDHRHWIKNRGQYPKDTVYLLGEQHMQQDKEYFYAKHQGNFNHLPIPEFKINQCKIFNGES